MVLGYGFGVMREMKYISLFLLFLPSVCLADSLTNIEVNCWNKAVDEDGSFLCQYVMVMGKKESNAQFVVPELLAPDNGGEKTYEQANRACQAMGFSYALRFDLESAEKEILLVRLEERARGGELSLESRPYLQHLNCGD